LPEPAGDNPWIRTAPPGAAVSDSPSADDGTEQTGTEQTGAEQTGPVRPRRDRTDEGRRPQQAPRASRPTRGRRERVLALVAELLIFAGAATGAYVLWTAILDRLHQPETPAKAGVLRRGPAPVLDEPPGIGDVFGSMQIPRFGADYDRPIAQGTDRERVLNTIGLGHYIGTAMPGDEGNFAVAGHRVTYGKPLNQIAEMQVGDAVVVRVTDPKVDFDVWYVYKTTDSEIVTPDKVKTIAPVPNHVAAVPSEDDRWLTLTACHPMWSAAERYVVHAKLDYWMQASEGTPPELTEAQR
jgi:sortase A